MVISETISHVYESRYHFDIPPMHGSMRHCETNQHFNDPMYPLTTTVPQMDFFSVTTDSNLFPPEPKNDTPIDYSFVQLCEEIAQGFSDVSDSLNIAHEDKPSMTQCTTDIMKDALTEAYELEDAVNAIVNNELPGVCLQSGCAVAVNFRGYCRMHGGMRRCEVAGCTKGVQGKNRCIGHGGGKRCTYPSCSKSENPTDFAKHMAGAFGVPTKGAQNRLKAEVYAAPMEGGRDVKHQVVVIAVLSVEIFVPNMEAYVTAA